MISFSAFTDEFVKIASSVAQVRAADAAYKVLKGIPLTSAQRAAQATRVGRNWSRSLPNRLDRAMVAAPDTPRLSKAHRRGISREMAAKAPTRQYVEQSVVHNPDIVDPATGKKQGALKRFAASWKRGVAYELPKAAG